MRKIISIDHVEEKTKGKRKYWITHALLDDGTEAEGFSKDFKIGDEVEVFFDASWNKVKMRKGDWDFNIDKDRSFI